MMESDSDEPLFKDARVSGSRNMAARRVAGAYVTMRGASLSRAADTLIPDAALSVYPP